MPKVSWWKSVVHLDIPSLCEIDEDIVFLPAVQYKKIDSTTSMRLPDFIDCVYFESYFAVDVGVIYHLS